MSRYIEQRAAFARPILRRLRGLIHDADSGLEETIKWGMPAVLYRGKIVCGFAGFKAHCALWFWKGSAIVGRKPKEAMGHFGRITGIAGLPSKTELKGYIRKSRRLIDEKSPRA